MLLKETVILNTIILEYTVYLNLVFCFVASVDTSLSLPLFLSGLGSLFFSMKIQTAYESQRSREQFATFGCF